MDLSNPIVISPFLMGIVLGLVELSKRLGIRGNWLIVASMAIGVVLGVLTQVAQLYPEAGRWVTIVIYGLAVGLAASGVYDWVDKRWPKGDIHE